MRCRKDVKDLTAAEKTAFVNAVHAVKAKPSVLHPTDPNLSRYDDYPEIHMNAMMASIGWTHNRPSFFPWHRVLLLEFENDLQAIDPSVTIPYWNWPNPASNPFTADFLGTNGSGANGQVTDGHFRRGAPDNWVLKITDNPGDPDFLQRAFGADPSAIALPTGNDVTTALSVTPYELSPYAGNDGGFRAAMEYPLHNLVHRYVGGTMGFMTSPNDPVFWMHHGNIDRLWGEWQRQHPAAAPYLPASGAAQGHNLNDNLIFNSAPPAPWSGSFTPAAVIDSHALGIWYATDAPELTLQTPSVVFQDVQQGDLTYRAIVFDVVSPCNPVALAITLLSAPFVLTPLSSVTLPAGDDLRQLRLWIQYTGVNAGDIVSGATATVTEQVSVGVGRSWVVDLSANVIAQKTSAVVLVLDRSGSMSEDAGGAPKVDRLREAASIFVGTMHDRDGVGIVAYSSTAAELLPVEVAGPPTSGVGRANATSVLGSAGLNPVGSTSIGAGIVQGVATLGAATAIPPYDTTAMTVLTDGMENTPPMIADVAASLTAHTFAIGLGDAGNVSTAALSALVSPHQGFLLITGTITASDQFRLQKYFLEILAGIRNDQIVVDPVGALVWGARHRIPFALTEADSAADAIVLCPAPNLLDISLATPRGTVIDIGIAAIEPAVEFVVKPGVAYYRMTLPALSSDPAGSHAGMWELRLALGARGGKLDLTHVAALRRALPYTVIVKARSSLVLVAELIQPRLDPRSTVGIVASLIEGSIPVEGRAQVWAQITLPSGAEVTVRLAERPGGQFAADFVADLAGLYTVMVRATGVSLRGARFTRQRLLTAAAFSGSDGGGLDGPAFGDSLLCELLTCLLAKHDLRGLEKLGFDLAAARECVEKVCGTPRKRAGELEATLATNRAQVGSRPVLREEAIEMARQARSRKPEPGFARREIPPPPPAPAAQEHPIDKAREKFGKAFPVFPLPHEIDALEQGTFKPGAPPPRRRK